MKACEELSDIYGVENCPECHCATGDDTEYKDFSNKYIVVCAQCGHEWDTRDLDEVKMGKLKTRVFDLYKGKFKNITELAKAMGISPGHAYKVQQGKRRVNQKFIIGVMKVFPGCLDDYFYID